MKRFIASALILASAFGPGSRPAAAADSRLPVLVVVGMKDEADIAEGPGVTVVIGAGSPELLRSRLKEYDRTKVRAVISFGISGGLDPALKPGDLTLPSAVVSGAAKWTPGAALLTWMKRQADDAGIKAASGIEAATDELGQSSPADRAALRAATGADGVDMESHIAAEFARAQGLSFAVVRAAADPYDFQLPPAALIPLLPDGTIDRQAVNSSIFAHPDQIGALTKLNGYYKRSLNTLRSAREAIDLGDLPSENPAMRVAALSSEPWFNGR
jgi:nucleoside phosphorylase